MIDRLPTPLRALVRDLVDKRLLPVAIALLVALVAVPLVIASSKSDAPPPAAAPSSSPAPGAGARPTAAITVAEQAVIGRSRPGAIHDPFFDPAKHEGKAASEPSQSAPQTGGAPSSAPAAATAPAGGAPAPSGPATTPSTTPSTTTASRAVYRTRVRWGAREDAAVRGISRLQPLGDLANPALLYLGTTAGGGRAVFLLGPNATSNGEEDCAEDSCRVIALKAGERTIVDVTDEAGATLQFALVIDDIVRRVMDTAGAANTLRAREHPDGRDVLREIFADAKTAKAIGQFAYDRETGAVVAIGAP